MPPSPSRRRSTSIFQRLSGALGTHGFTAVAVLLGALVSAGCSLFPVKAEYKGRAVTAEQLQSAVNADLAAIDKTIDDHLHAARQLTAEADEATAAAEEALEVIKRRTDERDRWLSGFKTLLGFAGVPAPVTDTIFPLVMGGMTIDTIRARRRARTPSAGGATTGGGA